MQTIYVDGRNYATPLALHQAFKRLLSLPDYYGCNADALHDCLTARGQPVHLWVASMGEGETARALAQCIQVFEDAQGQVRVLNLRG